VTNDEAKQWLEIVRDDYLNPRDAAPTNEALSIALWWAEREPLMAALRNIAADIYAPRSTFSLDLVRAYQELYDWEREHPRPGSDSRPPMSDDGPGNTL
jgi:hypothetical protein